MSNETYHASGGHDFSTNLHRGLEDITQGLQRYRVWGRLAWQDIVQRYRGSVLGPGWIALSTAIQIAGLGIVYGRLFKMDLAIYFPYVAVGLIVWSLMSQVFLDSVVVFTSARSMILGFRMPLSVHIYQMVFRNLITFLHLVPIYIIVAAYFTRYPTMYSSLAILGFAVNVITLTSFAFVAGAICARYRDIAQIVQSLIGILFFLTPIMWRVETIGPGGDVFYYSPIFSLIEIVRAPLLNEQVPMIAWIVSLGSAAILAIAALVVFARARARIVFWVL